MTAGRTVPGCERRPTRGSPACDCRCAAAATLEPCSHTIGTRIEIHLGEGLRSADALVWARSDAKLAGRGAVYRGRSSPHWYDGEAFFDLLQAAGGRSVRELVAEPPHRTAQVRPRPISPIPP